MALVIAFAPHAVADSEVFGRWLHTDQGRTLTLELAPNGRAFVEGQEGRYTLLDAGRLHLIIGRRECRDGLDRGCDPATALGGSSVAIRLPVDSVLRYRVSGDTMTVTGWVFKDAVFIRRPR